MEDFTKEYNQEMNKRLDGTDFEVSLFGQRFDFRKPIIDAAEKMKSYDVADVTDLRENYDLLNKRSSPPLSWSLFGIKSFWKLRKDVQQVITRLNNQQFLCQ
jgi:hypothetical protein